MEDEIIPEDLNDSAIREMIAKSLETRGKTHSLWNGIFEKLFDTKIVEASKVFVLAIDLLKEIRDVIFLYVCMKHIENINFYVSTVEEGSFHILVYGYKKMKPELFNIFTHIILMKGCDVSLRAYKNTRGDIEPPSIRGWFETNMKALPTENELRTLSRLSSSEQELLEILFDLKTSYSGNDTNAILVSRKNLFLKIVDPPRNILKDSFYAVFKSFFIDILNSGIIPTYLDICFFVTHFVRLHRLRGMASILSDMKEMIVDVVKRGIEIDEFIISQISAVDSNLSVALREAYAKPLWLKISSCKTDNYIPKKLRDLSIFLGHSPEESKTTICSFFKDLSESDPSVFVSNYIQRNIGKLAIKVTPMTKKIPDAVSIENSSTFETNPFEYPEIMIEYYKAENGKIYAFQANQFDILIRTGKYGQINLPRTVIYELQNKLRFLEFCEISPLYLKPIGRLIQEFSKSEILSANQTVTMDILNILRDKGYTRERIQNAQIENIEDKLSDMSIKLSDYYSMPASTRKLSDLSVSGEFIVIIFARILAQKNETMDLQSKVKNL